MSRITPTITAGCPTSCSHKGAAPTRSTKPAKPSGSAYATPHFLQWANRVFGLELD
ncbi:MAG: hypothetical protein NZT92_21870 [Abditibacteriales bacterium]|nr:hypothetical protein [Abditibacteriales bacterium]